MKQLNILNGVDFKCKYNVGTLSIFTTEYLDLFRKLNTLNSITPLIKLTWSRTSGTIYNYKAMLVDGRIWEQNIDYVVPGDPTITMVNISPFKFSEFAPHRDIRESISILRNIYDLYEFSYKVN